MTARRDDGINTAIREMIEDGVRVVGFIRAERVRLKIAQQRQRFRTITGFTARETEPSQRPQPFNQCVNLGAQPASGSSECLVPFFWGAPAAC